MKEKHLFALIAVVMGLCSCTEDLAPDLNEFDPLSLGPDGSNALLETNGEILERRPAPNPIRNAYFGDLHVHTAYSFDAYAFGTTATPSDAYRYARGDVLDHPSGYQVQLQQPMDFYAITDHALFLGLAKEAADTRTKFSTQEVAQPLHDINAPENMTDFKLLTRAKAFGLFVPKVLAGILDGSIDPAITESVTKSAWLNTIEAADQHYRPGEFTTFAAYEFTTSTEDRGNLHRNVIFRDTERLPAVPFSRFHSQNPEGLWDWMDGLRDQGIESLAIPHNSNGSNGQMFKLTDWAGNPMDNEYAQQRLRNEPLVEITQVKGTSETHPLLSKNDEWASFELMPYRVATTLESEPNGSYVRDAYLRGLALEEGGVVNPYLFGVIGSSDTHTGAASLDEETFFSKAGVLDGTSERRGSTPASFINGTILKLFDADRLVNVEGRDYLASSSFETWSASGLAAVWAEENTREAVYDAFRRKETFATSGPRIRLRFFGGYDFDSAILSSTTLAENAYRTGVPMGSDLIADGQKTPKFLIWAVADANGKPLQRAQIVKGYVRDGKHHEQIFDVACSDGLQIDAKTFRCPDNGAKVNLSDCSTTSDVGDMELMSVWEDPTFEVGQTAFYYARVLENPSCRWSTWDAIQAGVEPRADLAKTLQDRAWSSPIWYREVNDMKNEASRVN
jgi:hypothetical protein